MFLSGPLAESVADGHAQQIIRDISGSDGLPKELRDNAIDGHFLSKLCIPDIMLIEILLQTSI